MDVKYCKNEDCDNELDVFLANQYDGCCTPNCAMRASRSSRRWSTNDRPDEAVSNSLGRFNARLDRLCPTRTWTLDGYAAEVVHRTGASTLDELAEALKIQMHYDAEISFSLDSPDLGRRVWVKDRSDEPYTAALIAAHLYGIGRGDGWNSARSRTAWPIFQAVGDALLRALDDGSRERHAEPSENGSDDTGDVT